MKEFIDKLIGRLEEIYNRNDKAKKKAYEEQDWECFDLFTHRNEGIYTSISIVNQLAEEYESNLSESLTSWIPVTERLPKYDVKSEYYEEVIVTLDDGRVTVGCYRNLDEEWWVNAESGTKHAINATGHVIAWLPLPAPFRTEKAEWKDKVMNHFTKIE